MWSFAARRRERILRRHAVAEGQWRAAWQRLPLVQGLSADEQCRLRELTVLFLHAKSLEGTQGLELTAPMRLLLGIQACLPILELGLQWYEGWVSVIVYPGAFVPERRWFDEAGVEHVGRAALSGESWQRGPLILSWPDVEEGGVLDGHNLVIHEFAHKLDALDGSANGHPPLHRGMNHQAWADAFGAAFEQTSRELAQGRRTVLDPYAVENPAEFFAVASEAFLETPHRLRQRFPQLYEQLALFYRQDPAQRLPT